MGKKSYMDRKNIVSEGFYTKLFSLFVPKSVKKQFATWKIINKTITCWAFQIVYDKKIK